MEPISTKFDGTEGEFITAAAASRLQKKYIASRAEAGDKEPVRAQFFGRKMIEQMLENPKAMGIRVYLGEDSDGPSLVLVPTDAEGKNLVMDTTGLKDMPDAPDHGANGPRCPMYC